MNNSYNDDNDSNGNLDVIIQREFEQQNNLVGFGFTLPPNSKSLEKNYISGEIIKAYGFNCERLYINYELICDKGYVVDYEEYDKIEIDVKMHKGKTHISIENDRGKFHFNHPFELSVIRNIEEDNNSFGVALFLEICTEDSFGRYQCLGYGIAFLTGHTGYFEKEITTWRLKSNKNNEIHEFFLGGSIKLKNKYDILSNFVNNGVNNKNSINRFNTEIETTGVIRIAYNIITQSVAVKEEKRNEIRALNINKKREELKETIVLGPQISKIDNEYLNKFSAD